MDTKLHTLVINLQKSTLDVFQTKYELLERFYFRGHIGVADILVSNSREAIEAVAINPHFLE